MLSKEIITEYLSSPTNVISLASKINAKVGIEFEMVVSGTIGEVEEVPDYSIDKECESIEQILDFFAEGNARSDIKYLESKLKMYFSSWLDNKADDEWDDNYRDIIYNYAYKESGEDDENMDELYDQLMTENTRNRTFSRLKDSWIQDYLDDNKYDLEIEWLKDSDYTHMLDIHNEYDMIWPDTKEETKGGNLDLDELSNAFGWLLGRNVDYNVEYHGITKKLDRYYIEPDSSISTGSDETGLEFVSPPMSFTNMLADIKHIISWAKKNKFYTNKSTGLHINISLPNGLEKLDYVKLVLLLGDNYILNKFERGANVYCKPALGKINAIVRQNPILAKDFLLQMKNNLNTFSSKLITSTEKYTSINLKNGYVEFRSPGGDWLNSNIGDLESTIARFIVALDAAVDPKKYQQEYAKKFYKLIQNINDSEQEFDDPITYFANYVAGKITKEALINILKQIQANRKSQKKVEN
jgi:hypothetical protein